MAGPQKRTFQTAAKRHLQTFGRRPESDIKCRARERPAGRMSVERLAARNDGRLDVSLKTASFIEWHNGAYHAEYQHQDGGEARIVPMREDLPTRYEICPDYKGNR